jgi:hypothetical protein
MQPARKAVDALLGAVGSLVDSAVERVLISDERVTSAAEAKRLLAGSAEVPELADKIQTVVVLAAPVVRVLARGARFARVPWVMVASSSLSIGVAVRAGVRELQVLASLLAHRVEQTTGADSDPALIKKVAIDLPVPQAHARSGRRQAAPGPAHPQVAPPRDHRTQHVETRGKGARRGGPARQSDAHEAVEGGIAALRAGAVSARPFPAFDLTGSLLAKPQHRRTCHAGVVCLRASRCRALRAGRSQAESS